MASTPTLPIPISYISGRYLLFSIDAVTYLRHEYNICGVLIGTLPQIPQQNVFLGLPLELMPEEARLLVDQGVACIVDEAKAHGGMRSLLEEDRRKYLRELESQGLHASRLFADHKDRKREKALQKIAEKKAKAKAKTSETPEQDSAAVAASLTPTKNEPASLEDFFGDRTVASSSTRASSSTISSPQQAMGVTPATSYPPLPDPTSISTQLLPPPDVPLSFPLFAHLHSRGYFLSPGLRFGCQYVAYPGDPLRFHAHFLVVSAEWEEKLDLMVIINGGRLGTGVKKGFLLGGPQKTRDDVETESDRAESVRTFSIEWAGM
ncbi:tRNA-splicing endonuclease subunit tsp-4 [Penicillium macrosclerotiorum]|uniref:tRNA-splicing endonuclease subunit tsp-4 n=1 Tax=Penicillium macrosclerotiorum TaxID=303699 RepID=UPI002548FF03|nr:tRNA-splicing endonuclease subunit tsp-4 [Penicillium macrosclerotiorum]KAJ5690364.1 tRNA-splicing endonuclease subunit tsp-4 [Penicillium macrosclerotiorum]